MSSGDGLVFEGLHGCEVTIVVREYSGWTHTVVLDDFVGAGIVVSGRRVDGGAGDRRFEVTASGRLASFTQGTPVDQVVVVPPAGPIGDEDRADKVHGRLHAALVEHIDESGQIPTGSLKALLGGLVGEVLGLAEGGYLQPARGGHLHTIDLTDKWHTISHPESCQPVKDCPIAAAKLPRKPRLPNGRYLCGLNDDGTELVYGARQPAA